jgi:hypothetical protein
MLRYRVNVADDLKRLRNTLTDAMTTIGTTVVAG